MAFMSAVNVDWDGQTLLVSRCGYTGEDGYEISIPAEATEAFAGFLLADDAVEMIGLGARDSLRLEAGLCLYGHDIDTTTTPAQADLLWSVPKRRLEQANFPGADVVNTQIGAGTGRKRVGILPEGRAPAVRGHPYWMRTARPLARSPAAVSGQVSTARLRWAMSQMNFHKTERGSICWSAARPCRRRWRPCRLCRTDITGGHHEQIFYQRP